ncbi:MAG: type I restriction-modification system subunit M [Synergistaceae bacterium]|nr:type I restriction-modification system subunit M [Candidatus Equadaptatus faecalis]
MTKQQLAAKIWASANAMRSKIEANEYKDYILSFIFYKFLSDKEEEYLRKNDYTDEDIAECLNEDNEDTLKLCRDNLGYFIAYENLFSVWTDPKSDFRVANVVNALNAFDRLISTETKKNRLFKGIFNTLSNGLSKLGDTEGAQTKAISKLFALIQDIPMDGSQDYDVLGFIYEYLIANFAANAGKKAGEFYTPHEVSLLMSEIIAEQLKDKEEITILDPTSGSGSLLINIGKAVAKNMKDKNKIKYYAQELKENTYNLTRMNLVMRGINASNIAVRNADTLEDDCPYFDDETAYEMLPVDAVVSNPPYSQHWDTTDKENNPRFSEYGVAPKGKADYAFLLHDLYHVKNDGGLMTIVLPHGVLFRGGEEGEIRKNLIEHNKIDTIIGLPANIFFGTSIPTIIMVLKQRRTTTDILIIDASKGFIKEGKNNKLRACDIKKIADTIRDRATIDKFSRVVTKDEIRENDYNLNIPRYVDSSEKAENWDIYAIMFGGIPNSEIDELKEYWTTFPTLRGQLFKPENKEYCSVNTEDFKTMIENCADVALFKETHKAAFDGFAEQLKDRLIGEMMKIYVSAEEKIIGNDIFKRLEKNPLVDKYYAYQLLDDRWQKIATDLEILQTEGFDAVRKIDPNIVTKKTKDDKIEEVQKGWVGRIMPFELIQTNFFAAELTALDENRDKLAEIVSRKTDAWEEFEDDEKEQLTKDDSDDIDSTKLKNEFKRLKDERYRPTKADADSFDARLYLYGKIIAEEKVQKKKIKQLETALETKTISKINTLTDDEAKDLLNQKWILPLDTAIAEIPDKIIATLTEKAERLVKKYETTMLEVENNLRDTSKELSAMIDDLTGSDYDMQGLAAFKKLLEGENVKKTCPEKMFPKNDSKVPEIRFNGFTEDWEQRKFSDIAETRRGLTYTPENIRSSGIRVLRSSNIDEDTFVMSDDDVFVEDKAVNIPYLNNGDILITSANGSSRLVGKHAIINNIKEKSVVHGGFMLVASSKNPSFVNALMSAPWYATFINLYVAGGNGAIGNLNKNDLDNQCVFVPDVEEQRCIGEYFKNLDALIMSYQCEIEKLQNLKKALLEKMFVE